MRNRILLILMAVLLSFIPITTVNSASSLLLGVTGSGNAGNTLANYVCYNRFQASASGTANEVHIFGGSGNSNVKVALYSDNNGQPSTLLGFAVGNVTASTDSTIVINGVSIIQGNYYWIGYIAESAGFCTYNTSGYGGTRKFKSEPYASYSFPATWANTGYTSDNFLIFCGAYYNDGVPPLPPPPPPQNDTVICIGNSTTYGYPSGGNMAYTYLLQQCLPSYHVINKGINGDRTDQMLSRFQADVLALNPKYVIIWGGENDIAQNKVEANISFTTTNLSAMYTAAKAAGIKIIAVTIIPLKGWVGYTELRGQRINEINTWIKNNADVDYVIDAYALIEDGTGKMRLQYRYSDYAHLSTLGYHFIGAMIYGDIFNSTVVTLENRLRIIEAKVEALEYK